MADRAIDGLLGYCRQGFEPELAAELTERAAEAGFAGWARTERDSGFVVFACDDADGLSRALPWSSLIFARQKLRLLAELRGLDPKDRITPMLGALKGQRLFGELVMEHPDSDAGKPHANFESPQVGRALEGIVTELIDQVRLRNEIGGPTLEIF